MEAGQLVAAASIYAGFLGDDEWVVDMPGGRVYISKDGSNGRMKLCGPVVLCMKALLRFKQRLRAVAQPNGLGLFLSRFSSKIAGALYFKG